MSARLHFHTLDVFTERAYGGNPLAVVLDADALKPAQMQRIAREFNLSETVFVQRATRPDCAVRARIYTPFEELPFAGHPTVGTACLLAQLGLVTPDAEGRFALEEGVGRVPVRVQLKGDAPAYAELSVAGQPQQGPAAPDATLIAAMLGLESSDIGYHGEACAQWSCGLPFLLVPLRTPELLAGISVDAAALARLMGEGWAHSVYVYARGYEGELRARMFSPRIGEDPATGSAATALAARLASESSLGTATLHWTLHQGEEMGRPSRLHIEAERLDGAVRAVRVGGHAVTIMQGELRAP